MRHSLAVFCVLIALGISSGIAADPPAASPKNEGAGALPDHWEVSGTVVDEKGQPFAKAKVEAKLQGKILAEGMSDAAGKCLLRIPAEVFRILRFLMRSGRGSRCNWSRGDRRANRRKCEST
ncbi:MAG: carboxypeptidase-like regulatory domain-containing protein [Planctomycetales bacterium]